MAGPILANSKEEPFYEAKTLASVIGMSPVVIARLTGRTDLYPTASYQDKRLSICSEIFI